MNLFLATLLILLAAAVLTARPQVPLARLADPAPLPWELPVAGRLPMAGQLDPVPVLESTGPMHALTLSEISAGWDRLERQQRGYE